MNRSFIFVPAKDKMMSKIETMQADCIIIDLEDSIEAGEKEAALARVVSYLEGNTPTQQILVRLNRERYPEEANQLSRFEKVGFMLPKFEGVRSYDACADIWRTHTTFALVETPLGLIRLDETASCEWIDGVAFGAEDFTCKVNMVNSSETLRYQKSSIVTYCKAYNKLAVDTPSFKISDEDAFKAEVDDAAALGFDGKMLIHPKHIAYINERFGNADISVLKQIVQQYEENGQAVLVIDGKVYEKMHIDRFKKIIKENGGLSS